MKTSKRRRGPTMDVQRFNRRVRVGTAVHYWPGARSEEPLVGTLQCAAFQLRGHGHTAVAMVQEHSGAIAVSHIEPVEL